MTQTEEMLSFISPKCLQAIITQHRQDDVEDKETCSFLICETRVPEYRKCFLISTKESRLEIRGGREGGHLRVIIILSNEVPLLLQSQETNHIRIEIFLILKMKNNGSFFRILKIHECKSPILPKDQKMREIKVLLFENECHFQMKRRNILSP